MVKRDPAALDPVFGALADPTRRAILARLARGPASVGELAAPFAVSPPAVSRHLRVLERAGLLARERRGRIHRCRLRPARLDEAARWLRDTRAFWQERLDALDAHLAHPDAQEEPACPSPERPPSSSPAASRRRGRPSSAPGRSRRR